MGRGFSLGLVGRLLDRILKEKIKMSENRIQYVQNGDHKIKWEVVDGVHTIKLIKDVIVEGQLVVEEEEKLSTTHTED
jgi:hypothetical protein